MQYVFGPVPSRRLGQSMGIDTIPLKTCNWNCIYCQLGRTVPLTNERREYFPREDILREAQNKLASHQPGEIDWVTFVGSGEPALHTSIGWLIDKVKTISDLPVAVITNGALLYLPQVRHDLLAADAVLPSLDAGTAKLYRQINRPHPDITFECFLSGLITFRKEYQGKLWIEVMLVRDLNDTDEALLGIADALAKIGPDEVHLNLPTRPPVETWVQPPDEEGLLRATAILGDIAKIVHPVDGTFDLRGYDDVVDAIIGLIKRHPMRQEQIEKTLSEWGCEQVEQSLAELAASGQAQIVERYGTRFWSASPSFYPPESQSQATSPKSLEIGRTKDGT